MGSCSCGDDFISKANVRVSIQSASDTDDAYGGRASTWAEMFSAWAVIEPMAGKEVFLSAQLQSKVDARITIRYRTELSDTTVAAKLRTVVKNRIYNIKAVRNLADDMKSEGIAFQQLLCVEGEPS